MSEWRLREPAELGWERVDETPAVPESTMPTREAVQEALGKTSINYFGEDGETAPAPVIQFPKSRRHDVDIADEGW